MTLYHQTQIIRKLRIATLFIVLTCLIPTTGTASEIDEVVSTSPSWDTFTNKDGTGLYHEILRKVFALNSISVRHLYSKSNRSEELLRQGQADMMTCDDMAPPGLSLGRFPMYVNDYFVFYKIDRIGPWNGIETLRDREVLSQPTYYSPENFSVPVKLREIQTGPQALAMIVMDRSDFYVDDMTLIRQSIRDNDIEFDKADYEIKKVGTRSYHPLFRQTERGRKLQKMYEEGMLRLHRSGELEAIFNKWDYQYPDFDAY